MPRESDCQKAPKEASQQKCPRRAYSQLSSASLSTRKDNHWPPDTEETRKLTGRVQNGSENQEKQKIREQTENGNICIITSQK